MTDRLLRRATTVIRLPSAPERIPEVLGEGRGLRCPATGATFGYDAGVLDLLPDATAMTFSQRSLDTKLTAWFYDRMRDNLLKLAGLPDFPTEVATILSRLQVQAGDTVIDLACGHGNFTLAWAELVGADGLVVGIDLSRAMLARAAARIDASRATNVLLVHADAQALPIASGSIRRVNCSGGFHAFPDLPRALREIARISVPGAVLTASMFAENPDHPHPRLREWLRTTLGLHFVPLPWLGERLEALGYTQYAWSVPRGGFGYTSAVKAAR